MNPSTAPLSGNAIANVARRDGQDTVAAPGPRRCAVTCVPGNDEQAATSADERLEPPTQVTRRPRRVVHDHQPLAGEISRRQLRGASDRDVERRPIPDLERALQVDVRDRLPA